jgi:hypothetical protein
MSLFPFPRIVFDPQVIVPIKRGIGDDVSWDRKQLKGKHALVHPSTQKEVFAVQFLEHRVAKFAPYTEGGVILTEDGYKKLTGKELP